MDYTNNDTIFIQIAQWALKDLFKDKACSDKDTVFKLSLPTDAKDAGLIPG